MGPPKGGVGVMLKKGALRQPLGRVMGEGWKSTSNFGS